MKMTYLDETVVGGVGSDWARLGGALSKFNFDVFFVYWKISKKKKIDSRVPLTMEAGKMSGMPPL